jgi:hypothetical protein
MKKLELNQMENLEGFGSHSACQTTSSSFCYATLALLAFGGPFAPLAAATGIGCALGAYAGCLT